MSSRPRALSLVCWLAVAGLLVRIAVARGTFTGPGDPAPIMAIVGILAGLALLAVAVFLVAGFAAGSAWAPRVSRVAAILAVPYAVFLILAGHQSGSLISAWPPSPACSPRPCTDRAAIGPSDAGVVRHSPPSGSSAWALPRAGSRRTGRSSGRSRIGGARPCRPASTGPANVPPVPFAGTGMPVAGAQPDQA